NLSLTNVPKYIYYQSNSFLNLFLNIFKSETESSPNFIIISSLFKVTILSTLIIDFVLNYPDLY
ncbi:MAG: hypothetical protein KAT68_11740, partial [Bacteroidales bacterium]|nr:hypothetical protein [Bacteroidales bacterium]